MQEIRADTCFNGSKQIATSYGICTQYYRKALHFPSAGKCEWAFYIRIDNNPNQVFSARLQGIEITILSFEIS
jgi:hypothetical protein